MAKLILRDEESDLASPEAQAVKEFEKQLQYDYLHQEQDKEPQEYPQETQEEGMSGELKAVEAETTNEEQPEEPVMPKKRGRPPGSKNKVAKELKAAAEPETLEVPPPKRRGRPPGAKNKTTEPKAAAAPAAPLKRRGRPPKAAAPAPTAAPDATLAVLTSVTKITKRPDAAACMSLLTWFADHLANS